MSQNYLKFYRQNQCLPMRYTVSPFYTNFFMNDLENRIFKSNNKLLKHIFNLSRYMSDILYLWTGTERDVNSFVTFPNSIDSNIAFTIQTGNSNINLSDIRILFKQ